MYYIYFVLLFYIFLFFFKWWEKKASVTWIEPVCEMDKIGQWCINGFSPDKWTQMAGFIFRSPRGVAWGLRGLVYILYLIGIGYIPGPGPPRHQVRWPMGCFAALRDARSASHLIRINFIKSGILPLFHHLN